MLPFVDGWAGMGAIVSIGKIPATAQPREERPSKTRPTFAELVRASFFKASARAPKLSAIASNETSINHPQGPFAYSLMNLHDGSYWGSITCNSVMSVREMAAAKKAVHAALFEMPLALLAECSAVISSISDTIAAVDHRCVSGLAMRVLPNGPFKPLSCQPIGLSCEKAPDPSPAQTPFAGINCSLPYRRALSSSTAKGAPRPFWSADQ